MSLQNIKRIKYGIIFVLLLLTEVFIALFVHDKFIRPYIGDVLVVIVLYYACRMIVPDKCKLLPLYIFVFASGVELLQYFNIVKVLGLESNTFLRILVGSVFDIKDIICYGAGCILLEIYEFGIKFKE